MAALAAILLGPSAALYAWKGWKAERTLPSVLCAQSLLLILLGYFLPFSYGVWIVAALSAAAWVFAAVRVGSVRRATGFLSLPCLLFLLSIPILYHACIKRVYLSFDEHSHWGLIIKVITMLDELPRAGRGAPLIMYTYPPAAAMIPSMACTLLSYRDGIANLGYGLTIVGLMIGLLPEDGKREERLGFLLVYLCMMMLFPLGFLRLFSEPVIALLAALLVVRQGWERTKANEVSDCLYAAMLAMMKNTGIVILALVLIARLIARPGRKEAWRSLRMLLIAAAALLSYTAYCRVQGIEATASPSHFSENLRALLSGTLGEAYRTIPQRFAEFFLGYRLSQSGVYTCYGFGTCATVYAFLLLLSGIHVWTAANRRQALRVWAGIWTANALYVLTIVASYYFFFEEWEVARLSEADRYLMLPALWTGLMFCALLLGEREPQVQKRRCAAICLATLGFLPLSHPEMTYHTFVTQDYAYRTVWARAESELQAALLKALLPQDGSAKLLCMGSYDYVSLHYLMADTLDIGTMQSSWSEAPWKGDARAVREELTAGGYTHVFVGGLGEEDAQAGYYAELTADGEALRARSLYRVEQGAQGEVYLVYQETASDTLN